MKPKYITIIISPLLLYNWVVNTDVKASPPILPATYQEALKDSIAGYITTEEGEPIPAASVKLKNTNIGTLTDTKGYFKLTPPTRKFIVVVSHTAYNTIEIPVNNASHLNVKLKAKINLLDETVIIAYGTTTKRKNTGSVSKISGAEISKQPVSNPMAALIGRLPGVQVTQRTGAPGGNFTIQIRGQNSLRTDGNDPLIIIDGVPFPSRSLAPSLTSNQIIPNPSPFAGLNPSDIESIEVLKDADATAIYGSRGANGVMLITTKKGQRGIGRLNATFSRGVGMISRKMELLNTTQYLAMRREAYKNDGANPTGNAARDLLLWDTTRYTDWQKELIGGTAQYTNAQIYGNGGNSYTNFNFAIGYNKETTVFPTDFSDKKYNLNLNINHKSRDQKLNFTISTNYSSDDNDLPRYDPTLQALTLPPNAPKMFDDNNLINWENNTWSNPYSNFLQTYEGNTRTLIVGSNVSYKITPELSVRSNLGFTTIDISEIGITPKISIPPALYGSMSPTSYFNDAKQSTWIAEPQIEYIKKINKLKTSILVGSTFQNSLFRGKLLTATGFTSDATMKNISAATSIVVSNTDYNQYRYNAIFGRISLDFDNKYLLNLTARRDGSSRFGPNKRFANFGAAGVAWVFTEENLFLNNNYILSFGKIRASYGTTGSDQIGNYGYAETFSSTQYPYIGMIGLVPNRLANPDYAWEINKKFEGAMELGFFKDRILFSVNYYKNRSSSQLVGYPLPPTTGFSSIQTNLPATVQNTGFELELNTRNIQSKSVTWTTGFNITIPRSKLVNYPNIESSSFSRVYVVGEPLQVQFKYPYLGVDPTTGINIYRDSKSGNPTSTPVFPSDLAAIKDLTPKFYGGLQNAIRYKGFDLSFYIQYTKQLGRNYLQFAGPGFTPPGTRSNQPSIVLNRWQKPGDNTDIQKFTQASSSVAYRAYNAGQNSGDNTISDASFIRLKNIHLSYAIPTELLSRINLNNASISLSAQNLFTVTNYLGLDPETQSITNIPSLRLITASLTIGL